MFSGKTHSYSVHFIQKKDKNICRQNAKFNYIIRQEPTDVLYLRGCVDER